MKKIFIFMSVAVCLSLIFSSCKISYYQICEVGSNLSKSSNGNYEFKDNACTVSYNFWSSGGDPGFEFTNNTNEIIYVDLSKSFFIKNDIAYDYFLDRTLTSSSSISLSSLYSKSGTAYGFWNNYLSLTPGSISAEVSKGKTAMSSKSIEIEEKPIIAIPPHSSKFISEYSITSKYFYDCDYDVTPKRNKPSTYNFQLTDTPIKFSNFITYKVGDNPQEHSITNDFYINSISYYHEKDIIEKEKVGCPKDPKKIINIFKNVSPSKFYMYYNKELVPGKK